MAYCVLNYHQKASSGAYLNSLPMSNDPTIGLQAEMRLLSTKDHMAHSQSHPLAHHHQHMHSLHGPQTSQHLQMPNGHNSASHLHPVSTVSSGSSLSHRHTSPTSTSSLASNETNVNSMPRNRRRSSQQAQQPPTNDSQTQFQHSNVNNSNYHPHHYMNQRRSYLSAQSGPMSRQRNNDLRRGSTGSSVRNTSPSSASSSSSASSIRSCGSDSIGNTRSPSPLSAVPIGQCQRVPSPLSPTASDAVDVTNQQISSQLITSPSPVSSSTTTSASKIATRNHTLTATGPDPSQQVLSYEQVHRLHQVMEQVVPIHGRGNFPTLDIKLKTLVKVVRNKLENAETPVKVVDIRLNGGAASYVLSPDTGGYNDLDLIFAVDLADSSAYDRVRTAVLDSLLEFLPDGVNRTRLSNTSLKEAYIHKMVKVAEQDRWSLISLSNNRGRNVELKFVDTMKRQFEFSVDSFHIILDSLLMFYECSQLPISANIYPTVIGESVYGDFNEALDHLQNKLIATRNPEQIRGGGLLKYCNLLIRDYRPAEPELMKTLERYMCSRFFIDFNEITQQRAKLESYLANHFIGDDRMRINYLMQLYQVVDKSTVCLMSFERRQTLCLIEELALNVHYQSQQHTNAGNVLMAGSVFAATGLSNRSPYSSNFKMPYLTVSPLSSYNNVPSSASSTSSDARSTTPSVDMQSNGDSSDQESNESSAGDLCTVANCTCASNQHQPHVHSHPHPHHHHHHHHHHHQLPQYQTFVLPGTAGHFYYPATFQPGYGCFNSCHCGAGWMTCA